MLGVKQKFIAQNVYAKWMKMQTRWKQKIQKFRANFYFYRSGDLTMYNGWGRGRAFAVWEEDHGQYNGEIKVKGSGLTW